jgi:hypothetical protein
MVNKQAEGIEYIQIFSLSELPSKDSCAHETDEGGDSRHRAAYRQRDALAYGAAACATLEWSRRTNQRKELKRVGWWIIYTREEEW